MTPTHTHQSMSSALTYARTEHLNAVNALLLNIASAPAAPTAVSRKLYLLSMAVAQAWDYVSPTLPTDAAPSTSTSFTKQYPAQGHIGGVHDMWDFDKHVNAGMPLSPADAATWLTHAVIDFMPTLIPSYDPSTVMARERAARGWNATFQTSELARVRAAAGYSAFQAEFDMWYVK